MTQHTIMIVDDEPLTLKLLSTIFKLSGLAVVTAASGQAALALLEDHDPDMFILDMMMPDMDGVELCQRLRARPASQHTQVIFVSAATDSASMKRAFEAGASHYLFKPVYPPDLVAKVQSILTLPQLQLSY